MDFRLGRIHTPYVLYLEKDSTMAKVLRREADKFDRSGIRPKWDHAASLKASNEPPDFPGPGATNPLRTAPRPFPFT
jgi:hypothetical protein